MKLRLFSRVSILVLLFLPFGAAAQVIERVSVSSDGVQGDGESRSGGGKWQASDDGRDVVFESNATNLVDDDGDGLKDVSVRDLGLRTTARIGVNASGIESIQRRAT